MTCTSFRRTVEAIGRLAVSAALLALATSADPAGAAPLRTFHVATTGNNTASGTAGAPWRTLQRAANAVRAGDRVVVEPGHYAGFDLRVSGTAADPIVFSASPGVIIDQPNPVTPAHGINLEGASWIVIEGFTVTGMPHAGIRAVLNHHVTIRNNVMDANGRWGFLSGFSDDLLLENNVASRSVAEHGIYVSNSGDRPVIRGNHLWGNHACGLHLNGDLSMGGDGHISEALVEGNVVHDNGRGGGSGINGDGVRNSRFVNNLLYDNHASGLSLYRIDGAGGSGGNLIAHNTILQAADARWAINIADASVNTTVVNNILLTAHPYRGSISVTSDSLPGFVSDHNALTPRFTLNGGDTILSLDGWRGATGQDLHSIAAIAGELFVDPAAHDYDLRPGSPASDAGVPVAGVTDDIEGHPRPAGAAPDIGAVEAPGPAGPDLVVRVVTPLATSVRRGATMVITDKARNSGSIGAPASITRYYLSADAVRGPGDRRLAGRRSVPPLAPGATSTGTATVTIPVDTVPGTYRILGCADDRFLVTETDETNNCVASKVVVAVTP